MFGRNKLAALVAEFLGTGVLVLVVLSIQHSTIGIPYFWAIAAGLSVAVFALMVGRSTGAHFNPAITIGLWTARRVETTRAIAFIVVQLLGAWAAHGIYSYFVRTGIPEIHSIFAGRTLVAEAIGTGILSFGYAAALRHKLIDGTYAALLGIAYIVGLFVASAAAIGLANPALALGVHAWNIWGSLGWGNYVLGPVAGAVIGTNVYYIFFAEEGAKLVATSTAKTKKRLAKARA